MIHTFDIGDLLTYDPTLDHDWVLGFSFLNPCGSLMIVGPAGVGKSKYTQGVAFSLAIGRNYLGMKIHGPKKVLYVQAEEVKDDIAESIQGFVKHHISGDAAALADLKANLVVASVIGTTGDEFIQLLESTCEIHKPDVLVIDPLFAFMGCDFVDQGAVTNFLRVQLARIIYKHHCALICVHHSKVSKGGLAVQNAFGSAEFCGFFRGIIDLSADPKDYRSVTMVITKRQRQLGLRNPLGHLIDRQKIKMGTDGVYWIVDEGWARVEPGKSSGGRPPKSDLSKVTNTINAAKAAGTPKEVIVGQIEKEFGYSKKQAQRHVAAAGEPSVAVDNESEPATPIKQGEMTMEQLEFDLGLKD